MICLRPHHGMCLAYFEGKGYSDGFTVNMQKMLEFFEKGADIELTVSGDEICKECPNLKEGSCVSACRSFASANCWSIIAFLWSITFMIGPNKNFFIKRYRTNRLMIVKTRLISIFITWSTCLSYPDSFSLSISFLLAQHDDDQKTDYETVDSCCLGKCTS